MTRRWLLLADILGVAIRATARLLELRQLVFDRSDLRVGGLLVVLVTRRTRSNRNVGRQSAQRTCPRDVDVAGRALLNMIFFAAFVTEHQRLARWQIDAHERRSRLVATATVVTGGFQIFPMTGKASVMRMRHGLEKSVRRRVRLCRTHERHNVRFVVWLVTDRAVVVIGLGFVLSESNTNEAEVRKRGGSPRVSKGVFSFPSRTRTQRRDHVLMFVVRKLNRELPFVFWLRRLTGTVRLAKDETRIFARRRARVTDSADCRPGTGKRLPSEKLLPMTANAGVVIGKVCRVGKISLRRPSGRQLVTGVAREALMFVR